MNVADIIDVRIDKRIKPEFRPRDSIVSERMADISKAEKLLDFKYELSFEKGLHELIEDIQKNPGNY